MSEALVLIGGEAPEAPMAWASVDAQGRVERRGMAGEGETPAAAPARTILILPGADAHLKRLDLPARSEAQARAGAEMLFGGVLAGGGAMHYAVGASQDASGARLVAAISEARLKQWLERCRTLGADPHFVGLDCALWPVAEGEVAIAATPNRIIVAAGALGGFSIEPALAPPLTARWLTDANASGARIVLYGGDAQAFRRALGRDLETAPLPDPVAMLAQGAVAFPTHAPNLRQGAFAPAGRETQPLKFWRFAALLAAAAVMLQVGSLAISGWRDRQAADAILQAAERDFRAARPDVRRIVNLRAQVAALANAAEQAGRHPVLVVSDPVIQALRSQPLARLDEVRHDGPGRSVHMRLSAPQAAPLEALITSLREAGVNAEARAVQPREGRYAAEISVEAP